MEIYIVRHGETEWNAVRRLQGHSDIELNENGRSLAYETGKKLKGIKFDRVYSSPLKRAVDTANLILDGQGLEGSDERPKVVPDDRIIELSFGVDEGICALNLYNSPTSHFRHFFNAPELFEPSEGGEAFTDVMARTKDFMVDVVEPIEDVYNRNASEGERVERIMITAHGGLNKAIMCHIANRDVKDFWTNGLQQNCGIIIVRYEDGKYTIIEE